MSPKSELFHWIANSGFLVHSTLVFIATAALLVPVGVVGWLISGAQGAAAAVAGAFLCFSGGILALMWNHALRGPKLLIARALGGMLPRMGVPLLGGLVLQIAVEPLAEAGVLIYLLIFYPVLLSLETWLSLASAGMTGQGTNHSLPAQPTKND